MKKVSILDIVNQDLCTGCGLCVSESPSLKMDWSKDGFLVPILVADTISGNPLRVCPFNPSPDDEVCDEDRLGKLFLGNAVNKDPKIGLYENIYIGYSKLYRKTSSSGGIATYLFKKLLEDRIVENLFIVKEYKGTYKYQLFNDHNQILKLSKTRYIPVSLDDLFVRISEIEGRIAISGVACFIKAVRLKQYYQPELKSKIPFLVGIICGGLKSRFFTDYLAQKAGILSTYSNQEYRIKDEKSTAYDYAFGAFDNLNNFHQLKMQTQGDMWGTGLFKANACDFCDDVTTELADISLGDAWFHPYSFDGMGTSVIITRSKLAEELIINGISSGELLVDPLSLDQFKLSQKGSFNHRNIGMKYRLSKRRKNNQIVPFKRSRLLTNIPFEFKIVQNLRMLVRKSSIEIWEKSKNASIFDKEMKQKKRALYYITKLYQKVQKMKKMLHLKHFR